MLERPHTRSTLLLITLQGGAGAHVLFRIEDSGPNTFGSRDEVCSVGRPRFGGNCLLFNQWMWRYIPAGGYSVAATFSRSSSLSPGSDDGLRTWNGGIDFLQSQRCQEPGK